MNRLPRRSVAWGLGLCLAVAAPGVRAEEGAEAGPPKTADEIFLAGKEMADSGITAAAVDLFYRALSMRQDKRYYIALGHTLRDDGRRNLSYRAFQGALRLEREGGADYEGLLIQLAGMSVDLGELDEAKGYIEKLRRVDKVGGDLALLKYLFARGDQALEGKRYAIAFRSYSKALKLPGETTRAKNGCADALAGLADEFSSAEKFAEQLDVLLRLYRFRPLEDVAIQVRGAFLRAGKPKAQLDAVRKILAEHK